LETNIKNKKKPQTSFPPIRKYSIPPGPLAKRDKEKADLFAEHLREVFIPHNNDLDRDVERDLAKHIQPPEHLKAFTLKELKNEIKMLHPRRAPGIDPITAQMLKELPHEGFLLLMYIFNAILRLDYWPTSLKRAQIIMIPKPGKNPTDVTSYRPISLLPNISKVLEKLILKRINKDKNPHDWIPHHQFGFRQAHSTMQQCHRVTDYYKQSSERTAVLHSSISRRQPAF